MSLDIPIKVDPGDAVARAKGVEDSLHKTEDAGIAAGQAMLGLAGNFKSLAAALQQEQTALQRTNQLHDQLTRQSQPLAQGFSKLAEAIQKEQQAAARTTEIHQRLSAQSSPLAQGFGKIAEAMQREQQMLEKIHGPAQRYEKDLETLDALLAKNAISTKEYAEQVTHLNQQIGKTPAPKQQSGLGATASMLGMGALGGLGAGAMVGMLKSGAESVAGFIDERRSVKDPYIEIANSAQRFTSDTQDLNSVLKEQGVVASELHSTLKPTMELYDAIGDVTGDLNLSHRELIGLTKNLGEAALAEGKSLDSAGSIMGRLSIAMQAGADGGRQLQTIFREFPKLGEALAKAWHTDTAGVIEMVKSHKEGITDIVDVWKGAIPEIDQAAAHIKRTYAEQKRDYEEKLQIQFGKGAGIAGVFLANAGKDIDDYDVKGSGTDLHLEEHGPKLVATLQKLRDHIKDVATEMARTAEVERSVKVGAVLAENIGPLPSLLNSAAYELDKFGQKLGDSAFVHAAGDAMQHAAAVRDAKIQLAALDIEQETHARSTEHIAAERKRLNAIINDTVESQGKLNEKLREYQQLARQLLGGGDPISIAVKQREHQRQVEEAETKALNDYAVTIETNVTPALEKYVMALENLDRARKANPTVVSDLAYDTERSRLATQALQGSGISSILGAIGGAAGAVGGAAGEAANNTRETAKKMSAGFAEQAKKDAEEFKEAWAGAAGDAAGSLIKMAEDGKKSTGEMVEEIVRKLAMVAAQQAATQMGGPGGAFVGSLFGALGGGRDGFDYVANANQLQLPGFATGGDGIVSGGGSQDSQLLMARISAGESFHVRTSQQRMAEAAEWDAMRQAAKSGGGKGPTRVNLIMSSDPREVTAAMGTYAGERVAARTNRKFAKHRTG